MATQDPSPPRPEDGLSPHGLDAGDLDLLHMMLAMTPLERLRYLEDFLRGVEALKNARRVEVP